VGLGDWHRDVRVGARQLFRRPGFAAAALSTLALGIGLTTTLFGVVHAVLFRGTPIAAPDRLVEIYTSQSADFPQLTTSYPDLRDIRGEASAFEAVAAHAFVRGILSTRERGVLVTGEAVTANYFAVLGIRPALGRAFREGEDAVAGGAPVAVVSHGLWQRRFGARPDVLGEPMKVSGTEYTIVGVAPATFAGTMPGIPVDFWVPLTMVERLEFSGVQWTTDNDPGATRLERRGTRWLFVKGRLAPGRTVAEARAQVDTVLGRLRREYPATNDKIFATVLPASGIRFHPMLDTYVQAAAAVLSTAVALVLLIACANVANMLLARSTARHRELAIRSALGAGRARLVRQLLTEGLVLAAAGGTLGTLIAWWATRALSHALIGVLPLGIGFEFTVDAPVLAFALGVSTLTAVLFGLAPALAASRPDLVAALKATAEASPGPRRRVTARDVLVVGQIALSLVLLVAGALLARGLLAARNTDIGFDPAPLSSLSFNLQMNGYDVERAMAFRERAIERLRALPGVTAVSIASRLPLAPDINMDGITVPGHHRPGDDPTSVDAVNVGADYFSTIGVPLVAGRAFTQEDVAQGRKVVIVNETLARRYWPGGSAVGRLLHSGGLDQPAWEVVGIARDHKVRSVGEPPRPYVHYPAPRSRTIGLVVRTSLPAAAALPALRAALWTLEPDIAFTEDAPATDVVALTMAPTRIGAWIIGAFGALALLLASVGLYGVVAYSVSLRTREIGLRMALGAGRGRVLRSVLGHGVRRALAGAAIGAAASAAVGRVLQSLLYGVSALDPVAYTVAAGVLLAVAMAANLAPALVAARVDPIRALRSE
jgi:predicted permease